MRQLKVHLGANPDELELVDAWPVLYAKVSRAPVKCLGATYYWNIIVCK